ncbi:MAG: tyrosine-type recombinase/integrase [Syntrophobacteraceae bacterium]|jgi:integrase
MSIYLVKGKGFRHDFTLKGERYTEAWFQTKKAAQAAEAKRREEIKNPKPQTQDQTHTTFLDLVNMRLDFIKEYKTLKYYDDNRYALGRLVRAWEGLNASEITTQKIQDFILIRAKRSHYAANYDLTLIKALFNHGVRMKLLALNPASGVDFLPVENRAKYVPPLQDIDKVIAVADSETQDYLWCIRETLARVSEINRLKWDDVDLEGHLVTLYTRKKKGGSLTPRKIPMTGKLFEILSRRYLQHDPTKPWVFWHRYWSRKAGEWKEGPFLDRKTLMKGLCLEAGVKYFRYHALRHSGASLMDHNNAPLDGIQNVLGHETRTTTLIYLHKLDGSERKVMQIYEQARQKSHTDSHIKSKGILSHTPESLASHSIN